MLPCGIYNRSYEQDTAIVRTRFQWSMLILLFIFLFAVYPLIADDYMLSVAIFLSIGIVAALGLSIVTGYCGQINIGQAAFVCVGAYTAAILGHHLGWSAWAALPVAIVSTTLVGLIFGLPSLKIRGFYIAVTTLAAQFIVTWVIVHGGNLTGGIDGLSTPLPRLGSIILDSELKYYYLAIGVTCLMTFFAKSIVRSKLGRAFVAIRDNDLAAQFMGINIFRYKLLAFMLCAAFAGVAGWLHANYLSFVSVEQFTLTQSIWYLGYIIVGGMGSITGTIFGVLFLKLLGQAVLLAGPMVASLLPALQSGYLSGALQVAFGITIIVFLIFEPLGLYHRWQIIKSSIRIWPFPY